MNPIKKRIQKYFNFAVVIIIAFSCTDPKAFSIKGSFTEEVPTPVKLYLLLEEGGTLVDSINLEKGKTFKLNGEAENPSIYLLKFFNGQSIYLVIHPGDNIEVDINNSSSEITYFVEGSADSKLINELVRNQIIVLKGIDHLSKKLAENPDDIKLRKSINSEYARLIKEHRDYTTNFIYSNPKSLANILALYQNFGVKTHSLFDKYDDIEIYDFVDSNLISLYPGSQSVKVLDRQVAEAKEQIQQKSYFTNSVTVGRILAPFQGTTINGDTILFVDGQSNLNIIYFWASWNSFSLNELKNLNTAMKRSGKGINIISVSLDNSADELRKALLHDSISIPVVCDYKYWESALVNKYSVRRIPAVILTNKDGLVIAKDIFSDELFERLTQNNKSLK